MEIRLNMINMITTNKRLIINIRSRALKMAEQRQERSKQLPAPPPVSFPPLLPPSFTFAHVVHNCLFPFGHSSGIQPTHPPHHSHEGWCLPSPARCHFQGFMIQSRTRGGARGGAAKFHYYYNHSMSENI